MYSRYKRSLLDMWFADTFTLSIACLFILFNRVFFRAKGLNFDEVQFLNLILN